MFICLVCMLVAGGGCFTVSLCFGEFVSWFVGVGLVLCIQCCLSFGVM